MLLSDNDYAGGLYALMVELDEVLGGGFDRGSGIDFQNEVFESRNYWALDSLECTCPYGEWESGIEDEVEARMSDCPHNQDSTEWWRVYQMEWGNVTQGEVRGHDETCDLELPCFHHFGTGLKVTWYKRIGRDCASNRAMSPEAWYELLLECHRSIRVP